MRILFRCVRNDTAVVLVYLLACYYNRGYAENATLGSYLPNVIGELIMNDNRLDMDVLTQQGRYASAIVAGGCFWCIQGPFDVRDGVTCCLPGYTGGEEINPDYKSVCSGETGHVEAMLVIYDPELVTYEQLLAIFWCNIDPTQVNGQFADHGSQYRTAIFYVDDEQKAIAEASRAELAASGHFDKPIATEILPYTSFYKAEDYHIDYYKKNPSRYKMYQQGSGRAAFIQSTWAD